MEGAEDGSAAEGGVTPARAGARTVENRRHSLYTHHRPDALSDWRTVMMTCRRGVPVDERDIEVMRMLRPALVRCAALPAS